MSKLIERLDKLAKRIPKNDEELPYHTYHTYQRQAEALINAYPKLRAVIEAASHARYPNGLENLDKALAALNKEDV